MDNFRKLSPHIADYVYAPKVYWNLSTTKLLTMEFVEGAEVNDLKSIQKLGINPHDIARLVSRTFAEMMFKHGFVHCDPHAANLLVRTMPSKRGIFVPSTVHGMLKFPVEWGVVTICSTILIPTECASVITSSVIPREERTRPANFKVALHPDFPDQEVVIGGTLSEKGRTKLCSVLEKNLDIFAWQPSDMTRVPRSIAEHRLNIREGYSPVRQKKRGQAPERAKAIQAEVQKLVYVGIMRDVYYHNWLSNPVIVKKHDGSWRMCVDFTDLNKACPQDCYPLLEIDWKVESLCGYPFKCFLDAYKGYHQIQLAEADEEKIAFHTGQGVYCYTKMPFGLKNAGVTYQRLMDKAFEGQIGRNIEVLAEGMFLGYVITPEGIKPCPDKTAAVLQLPSSRTIKEVQSLNGKLASLNRFLSKSAEKSMPLFQTLKKCIKKSDFHWIAEAEQAFQQLKHHLSELPLLVAPKPQEELVIYLSAAYGAISAVLMIDRGTTQTPIYFISRALQGPELNYSPMEKLVLSLVFAAKRLRRYFQAHLIMVITDQPIKQVMSRPDVACRLQKWSIMLGEYNVTYRPRTSVKGQIFADFLIEMPGEVSQAVSAAETQEKPWTLFTDGSSCVDGGAWLILTSPEVAESTYALRFQFTASNNEAEYEALVAGLRIAARMGVKNVQVSVDSKLVANQVLGTYVTKEDNMIKYLEIVKGLVSGFTTFSISQVPRSKNKKADALSKIASTSFAHLSKQEYLLEFTFEYGIPEALHRELPGPEDRIVDFPEGKILLSQLSVIGVAKVSHFEINCRVLNIIPTLRLFRLFYTPSFNSGWISFSKRLRKNIPQCYTKPLDSLKNWNNRFFWMDERVFPTVVDWRTSAPKDGMPAENTYSVESVRTLDTHPIDLFSLIRAPNPTKVKTGSCPRAAYEVPLLTVTSNRVIEMKDPAAATDFSGVPSTTERSPLDFANEAGASDQGATAPEVLPSEDVPTTRGTPEAGQAKKVTAIDPSTVTESRKRGHDGADANVPPRVLRRDHADPRPTGSTLDIAQSSQGTAAVGDPESENASFAYIHFMKPRTSVKGQILADFLIEMSGDVSQAVPAAETQEELWTLFTDGSSCVDGSGAWLILTSPKGVEFTYALRFQFIASNNEAEYEALVARLRIAARIGVQNIQVSVDSKLVANQVLGTYVDKEDNMIKYLEIVKGLYARRTAVDSSQSHTARVLLADNARDMIRKCSDCQVHRPVTRHPQQHLTPITTPWPFYKWGIDIVGPFSGRTREGKIFNSRHGLLHEVDRSKGSGNNYGLTDNGKQFSDNPFKDWCDKLNITQRFASVKHPQSNGLVERANRSLGEGIKSRLGERNKNWVEELPHVLWAHRTMIKSSHGDTTFSLTYGTEAVIPTEIGMPTYRTATVDVVNNDEELRLNLDLLEERRERAAICEAKAKSKMMKYYNARVRGVAFKPGDFVYRSNDGSHAVAGGKLGPK
nr:reverse transcriptase domain-containing protein [Tanacetum cinerariifolium]